MILNKAEYRRRLTMLTGLLAAGHVAMAPELDGPHLNELRKSL